MHRSCGGASARKAGRRRKGGVNGAPHEGQPNRTRSTTGSVWSNANGAPTIDRRAPFASRRRRSVLAAARAPPPLARRGREEAILEVAREPVLRGVRAERARDR